jgi:hypothetical protein
VGRRVTIVDVVKEGVETAADSCSFPFSSKSVLDFEGATGQLELSPHSTNLLGRSSRSISRISGAVVVFEALKPALKQYQSSNICS